MFTPDTSPALAPVSILFSDKFDNFKKISCEIKTNDASKSFSAGLALQSQKGHITVMLEGTGKYETIELIHRSQNIDDIISSERISANSLIKTDTFWHVLDLSFASNTLTISQDKTIIGSLSLPINLDKDIIVGFAGKNANISIRNPLVFVGKTKHSLPIVRNNIITLPIKSNKSGKSNKRLMAP